MGGLFCVGGFPAFSIKAPSGEVELSHVEGLWLQLGPLFVVIMVVYVEGLIAAGRSGINTLRRLQYEHEKL